MSCTRYKRETSRQETKGLFFLSPGLLSWTIINENHVWTTGLIHCQVSTKVDVNKSNRFSCSRFSSVLIQPRPSDHNLDCSSMCSVFLLFYSKHRTYNPEMIYSRVLGPRHDHWQGYEKAKIKEH